MQRKIFILILLFVTINLSANDCKTRSYYKDYLLTDYIFFGEIIEVSADGTFFKIRVDELLKGNLQDTIIASSGSKWDISIIPEILVNWLFFADSISKDTIFISQCSHSIQLNSSIQSGLSIPKPIFQGEKRNLEYLISESNRYSRINEVFFNILRAYNTQQLINQKSIVKEYEVIKKQHHLILFYTKIIAIILILQFMVIVWILIKRKN